MIKQTQNLIVFDMDGVLVDVSASYREAVRMTARLFFKGAQDWEQLPSPLFSLAEIAAVKQTGGLNNDWDLTYRILDLLLTAVRLAGDLPTGDPWTTHKQVLEDADLTSLIQILKTHDTPLQYLLSKKNAPNSPFVQHLSGGDVASGNVIKQIFQELYLGKDLFVQTYNLSPQFHNTEGLINHEKLLARPDTLQKLAAGNLLAIATGRPKAEAAYPLRQFKISSYFESVLTLDDCLDAENAQQAKGEPIESFSKPHPFMLDRLGEAYERSVTNYFYIGDMPDDMTAASRSKFGYTGLGFIATAPDKQALDRALRDAGALDVVDNMEALSAIIKSDSSN